MNLVLMCFGFWAKCMKNRGYTWYMREWGGKLGFGDFLEYIVCQFDVANCVN